jgi:imidazolonepropionase
MVEKCVIHASEVLTGEGIRAKDGRRVLDSDLGRIEDGAVVHDGKKILWVGKTRDLPKKFKKARTQNLQGKGSIVPGFVDCHTHLIFAGDRANEFARRCAGASYEEIAREGGGILTSVNATRRATKPELLRLAIERVEKARSYGVRTLEIKSGYGLDLDSEIKVLQVAKTLKSKFPDMTFSTTFLGAHSFPKEKSREQYMKELLEQMLPKVAKAKLADACDIFVDEGYFTTQQARELLLKAKALRMEIKIHADELGNTESASLAAELGCLSADHLLQISNRGIAALAKSDTVAVLLPGTAFYLKAAHAPARALIDQGACVALSTDFNPGTCMTLNLPTIMTIAALYLKMSRAEIFAAVTYNAAKALGLHAKKGTLVEGMDSDFVVLPVQKFEEIYYRFAW